MVQVVSPQTASGIARNARIVPGLARFTGAAAVLCSAHAALMSRQAKAAYFTNHSPY
jgi:hypothetical protein